MRRLRNSASRRSDKAQMSVPAELTRPRVGRLKPADHGHEGGFARARAADDGGVVALSNLQIDPAHRLDLAAFGGIGLGEPVQVEHGPPLRPDQVIGLPPARAPGRKEGADGADERGRRMQSKAKSDRRPVLSQAKGMPTLSR